jgi:hypothetical protein
LGAAKAAPVITNAVPLLRKSRLSMSCLKSNRAVSISDHQMYFQALACL